MDGGGGGSGTAAGGWGLLRAHGPFRVLCGARTVSVLGESAALVALLLFAAGSTGRAVAVAALLLVGDFAPALLAPLAGVAADRFDLRRVMAGCEAVQGAALAAAAVWLPPLPPLLVLVAVRAVAGQVFLPASRAAVPALVRGGDLAAANAVVGFGANGAEALGPLLAAALLPLAGVRGVLAAAAACFLLSAAALLVLPPLPAAEGARRPARPWAQAWEGLGLLWRTPRVRAVVLGFGAVVACNGVDDVALTLLATETLDAGGSAAGLLLGAVGIGLAAGYAWLSGRGGAAAPTVLLLAGFAVSSAGNLLTGLAWSVAAAFALQTVRGAGIAAMDVAATTLLQRGVEPRALGRVFGNFHGVVGAAAGASYVAGGLLLDATSPPAVLLAAGAGGLAATAATAVLLRRGP